MRTSRGGEVSGDDVSPPDRSNALVRDIKDARSVTPAISAGEHGAMLVVGGERRRGPSSPVLRSGFRGGVGGGCMVVHDSAKSSSGGSVEGILRALRELS